MSGHSSSKMTLYQIFPLFLAIPDKLTKLVVNSIALPISTSQSPRRQKPEKERDHDIFPVHVYRSMSWRECSRCKSRSKRQKIQGWCPSPVQGKWILWGRKSFREDKDECPGFSDSPHGPAHWMELPMLREGFPHSVPWILHLPSWMCLTNTLTL